MFHGNTSCGSGRKGRHQVFLSIDNVIVSFCLVIVLLSPCHVTGSDVSVELKNGWIDAARDEAASVATRIEALDSLVIRFDPLLFEFFKDIAFRSENRDVALVALDYISSFAQTYRWLEACDTLTAVMRSHPDEEFRAAALQANKIAYYAIVYGAPFDRNHMVDVLIEMVATDTYIRDAQSFLGAVWLLANVADNTQIHAISALEYVRDHYDDYKLNNEIDATDAIQKFKSSIRQEYFDCIDQFDPPPLIDTFPENASTPEYITTAGFMLDSAATDSLGFLALDWLKENGSDINGDEGIRLLYLNAVAALKRPDISAEVRRRLLEILPRFGVHTVKPIIHKSLTYSGLCEGTIVENVLYVDNLSPGDHICLVTLQGRVILTELIAGRRFYRKLENPLTAAHYVLLINGQPIPIRIVDAF